MFRKSLFAKSEPAMPVEPGMPEAVPRSAPASKIARFVLPERLPDMRDLIRFEASDVSPWNPGIVFAIAISQIGEITMLPIGLLEMLTCLPGFLSCVKWFISRTALAM